MKEEPILDNDTVIECRGARPDTTRNEVKAVVYLFRDGSTKILCSRLEGDSNCHLESARAMPGFLSARSEETLPCPYKKPPR